MLTALGNFGGAVSSYIGAVLLVIFNVTTEDYSNLQWVVVVKMCCRCLTLLLIPHLIPWGCPNDPPDNMNSPDSKGNYGYYGPDEIPEKPIDSSSDALTSQVHSNMDSLSQKSGDASSTEDSEHGVELMSSRNGMSSHSSQHRVNSSSRGMTPVNEPYDTTTTSTKINTSKIFQYMDVSNSDRIPI